MLSKIHLSTRTIVGIQGYKMCNCKTDLETRMLENAKAALKEVGIAIRKEI